MEIIRLGRGPDFCMWRGLEIINYRISLCVEEDEIYVRKRTIVDRSLLMAAKKSKLVLRGKNLMPYKLVEKIGHNQRMVFKEDDSDERIVFQFHLPSDLRDTQLAIIYEFFRGFIFP